MRRKAEFAMDTAADMSSLKWPLADAPEARAERAVWLRGWRGAPLPLWADVVADRIEVLADLETVNPAVERPLNADDVVDALLFLEGVMREDTCPPWIGRLSSGGVEMAWKHGDVEVEAVFDRQRGDSELLVTVGDHEWDAPVDKADSLFASVIDRLSNSYIADLSEAPADSGA